MVNNEVSQLLVTYTWPLLKPWGGMRDHSWVCLEFVPIVPGHVGLAGFYLFIQVTAWAFSSVQLRRKETKKKFCPQNIWVKTGLNSVHPFIRKAETALNHRVDLLQRHSKLQSLNVASGQSGRTSPYSPFTIHYWPFTSDRTLLNSKTSSWPCTWNFLSMCFR